MKADHSKSKQNKPKADLKNAGGVKIAGLSMRPKMV
jgi:hypothetical protein